MKITSFAEATEILNGYIPRPLDVRAVYNLDTIQALAAFLGNPQDKIRVIHVAGTSGKTSTAYYAAALLRAAGKNVGLTVSPHITEINERVQINLVPLPEAEFCSELGLFMEEVEKSGLKPTYFELMMAFAYWEFVRQQVDYIVVEVGLGGLLDGSNIVTRPDKVCVITDIGFDHMNVLGSTLTEIATQKAGIIHEGNAVFMHAQTAEVMDVVSKTCHQFHATLHVVTEDDAHIKNEGLPLYQQRNMGLAIAAVRYALDQEHDRISSELVHAAALAHIPGRMEVVHIGDKTVILDGAHNPQKLQAMTESLRAQYPETPMAALVGFVQSKEVSLAENAALIGEVANTIIVTPFGAAQEHGRDAIEPARVAEAFKTAGVSNVTIAADYEEAVQRILQVPERVVLITGSLYLISYVRPLLLGDHGLVTNSR